ncbi:Rab-GAP TBC domain-containing protein [Aphelenchoides besseyi]|nr:Rab-GAP TBC domain-containing protein [Aphelenchoides besseyi]
MLVRVGFFETPVTLPFVKDYQLLSELSSFSDSEQCKAQPNEMQSNSATSFDTSFSHEWSLLFGNKPDLNSLKNFCLSGCLRDSRIRSIVWRVLLRVVSPEPESWPNDLAARRTTYEKLKADLNTNPRTDDVNDNLDVNNPLSLQNESPWQQYFNDETLRDSIRKDVDRAFPEVHFFQSQTTRQIMMDVLFVYSKMNRSISYRQGMVDVLAPILFAIYFDHRAFDQLKEQNGLTGLNPIDLNILNRINNANYLEHDAFFLFSQLMIMIKPWYADPCSEIFPSSTTNETSKLLFKSGSINVNDSNLIHRLKHIEDKILQRIDPLLYEHLQELEIPFEVFGIRWLRLLFGREFPVNDLLFVWDVILTDDNHLETVDYIFVALLIRIRKLLLAADYTSALLYCMHYPPVEDVHQFIRFVLYLKSPLEFAKPKNVILSTQETNGDSRATEQQPSSQSQSRRNTFGSVSLRKPKSTNARTTRNECSSIQMNELEQTATTSIASFTSTPRTSTLLNTVLEPPNGSQTAPFVSGGHADVVALQLRLQDALDRADIGAFRVLEAASTLERCCPNQKSLAAELRTLAAYIRGESTDDYWHFTDRRSSISKPIRPLETSSATRSRQNSGNPRASQQSTKEMIEMHFARKKNF